MKELVIASNNEGKIREIRALLPGVRLLSLGDIGFDGVMEEPFHSFEENALAKAGTIHRFSGRNVLADDSGICVRALQGAPGVHSAYFGGEPRSDEANNNRLLEALQNEADRSAYYKAVICLIWEGETYFFEGICEGTIALAPQGAGGFGYDPLFIPEGQDQTFGELPPAFKNQISHRAKALEQMAAFLHQQIDES